MATNRARVGIVAVAAATSAAALGVLAHASSGPAPVTTSAVRSPAPCTAVLVDNMSRAQVDVLTAAGWLGDPADHQEKLYAPACPVPLHGAKRHAPTCDPVHGGGIAVANLRPAQITALTDAGWLMYDLSDTLRAAYAPECSPN